MKAVSIKPDFAEAYYNLFEVHLKRHWFNTGFKLFDWRWKTKQSIGEKLKSTKPEWRGQKKKRIFVYSEQGIGDVIMFSSMLIELAKISDTVIFSCDKRLVPLFERSFSFNISVIERDTLLADEQYDFHIPVGALPSFFRKDIQSFEATSGSYLKADKYLSSDLRKLLSKRKKLICGVSWKGGSLKSNVGRLKDVGISEIGKIFNGLDITVVNLQYNSTEVEIKTLKNDEKIDITCIKDIDNFSNLDGLAALINACDCVVSVDNLTIHLSGALGVKTFVLLPFSSNWRWGFNEDNSYWHSELHLLRQQKMSEWKIPLKKARAGLKKMIVD